VQAVAEVSGDVLAVRLVGVNDPRQEECQLQAYLKTWLGLYGQGVEAEVKVDEEE
jgi:hypothetical protein